MTEPEKKAEKKDPRSEGITCYVLMKNTGCFSMDDCKYAKGTPEREQWMEGWDEANVAWIKENPVWEEP